MSKGLFDTFTGEEAALMEAIIAESKDVAWAAPILAKIEEGGGLTGVNMPWFFELRFGYALRRAGIDPKHEIPGEGDSTLDFGFEHGGKAWNVELLRLEETDAVKAATTICVDADGTEWTTRILRTGQDEQKQSSEGETLKAVERICQKLENGGKPHKFPPADKAINVLLVDFRNFATRGGDKADRVHVALGGDCLPEPFRMYWEYNGKRTLVTGAFNPRTKSKGADNVRERLHLLGFVNEREFKPESFGGSIQFFINPNLVKTEDEARPIADAWPLKGSEFLNLKPKEDLSK